MSNRVDETFFSIFLKDTSGTLNTLDVEQALDKGHTNLLEVSVNMYKAYQETK